MCDAKSLLHINPPFPRAAVKFRWVFIYCRQNRKAGNSPQPPLHYPPGNAEGRQGRGSDAGLHYWVRRIFLRILPLKGTHVLNRNKPVQGAASSSAMFRLPIPCFISRVSHTLLMLHWKQFQKSCRWSPYCQILWLLLSSYSPSFP